MTTNVVEITHIVYKVKSLTVPCSSRLTLIFFSSGHCFSCCPLGAWTACWKTVGFSSGLQFLRPSWLNWTEKREVGLLLFLQPPCRTSVSWERDWVTACRRFGSLLLHPTCTSGWVSCTVLKFSPCSQFFTYTLRGAATLWRRLRRMKTFIHHHTKKKFWKGNSNLPRVDSTCKVDLRYTCGLSEQFWTWPWHFVGCTMYIPVCAELCSI